MSAPFSIRTIKTTYHPERKEWSAPPTIRLYDKRVSLGQLVITALSSNLHAVGQISHDDGHEMKNWEILRDSVRAALNLRKFGLKEGDVLGFAATNSRHVSSIVFGALINGYPLSTVNSQFEVADVAHTFSITEPKVVFCDESNYKHVKGALMQLNNPSPVYVFTDDEEEEGVKSIGSECFSVHELLKAHPEEEDFL